MPLLADTEAFFVGDQAVDALYLGDTLVWQASDLDPDTAAYIAATGLDPVYAPTLDALVKGLKSVGLWAKMLAIYPFIGGTAELHKWNLKDPRDLDAAYRLTYSVGSAPGGHSTALGYQPNAAAGDYLGYADTHLIPQGLLDPNSSHLSLYSLADRANGPRCDMGMYNWGGTALRFHIISKYTSGEMYYTMSGGATPAFGNPSSTGLHVATRQSGSVYAGYRHGALGASNVETASALPPISVRIGGLNGYDREFSDLPLGFASIGAALNDQDVVDLNRILTDYQTALGRRPAFTSFW